jgi:glycosyltransferase involved in cell wall biosynthesis
MGVDETFIEIGKNRKIEISRRPSTILSNRNLLPIYNVSLLIRAIPMVLKEEPKTKFLIAGEGSEKENLKSQVKNLNLSTSVQFLGRIPHKEMPNLLAKTDIYVSTSLYDGTSVSLLEALASGAFPVVTDIPSNREWITDGDNGFLVPIDEAGILASRILDAIRNRDFLEKSQSGNLLIVERKAFWPTNIKRLEGIYSSLFSNVA